MKRKKRNPVGLVESIIRHKASEWFRHNKDEPFDIPRLTDFLGYDGNSRNDTSMIYQQVIKYWRSKFIDYYRGQKEAGVLNEMDRYRAWDTMLYNYNQNDAYVFLYNRKYKQYEQPDFRVLEEMDRYRLERQWRGIGTVIEEMQTLDAQFVLSDGSRKPIGELLSAGKEVDKLLIDRNDEK